MNKTIFIQSVLLFILVVGCNRLSKSEKTSITSTGAKTISGNNVARISLSEDANSNQDFKAATATNDFRFIAIQGYVVSVPGVPNFDRDYTQGCT